MYKWRMNVNENFGILIVVDQPTVMVLVRISIAHRFVIHTHDN